MHLARPRDLLHRMATRETTARRRDPQEPDGHGVPYPYPTGGVTVRWRRSRSAACGSWVIGAPWLKQSTEKGRASNRRTLS